MDLSAILCKYKIADIGFLCNILFFCMLNKVKL